MQEKQKENMISMFKEAMELSKRFDRNTYEKSFRGMFEKRKNALEKMVSLIRETKEENQEELIQTVGSMIPEYVDSQLRKLPSKRKREQAAMDYNLAFATYLIPLFLYSHDKELEQIADVMIQKWNRMSAVTTKVRKATFEDINGGFKRRRCYVTTAVCQSLHKSDDCYELCMLRNYRDEYLAARPGGKEIIREYYNIAPTIVKRINRKEESRQIYQEIWERYLKPCIALIEKEEKEKCREVYTKMVRDLEKKYLYS